MKKFFVFCIAALSLIGCHDSLEERAKKDTEMYTLKKCPTPIIYNERTDSIVFEPDTRTIHYYLSLFNEADDDAVIALVKDKKTANLLEILKNDMQRKAYKDEGFNFRYTYVSGKNPKKVYIDVIFKKGDY